MKTLNVKLVAILLGGTLVFAAAVYGVHYIQVRRYAHVLLQRADEAEIEALKAREEEDFEGEKVAYVEAMKKLSMYTNLIPNDIDAVQRLGLLQADLGDFVGAYGTLEKVLRADPERENVRRKQVEVAMALGRVADAQEHLEDYLLLDAPDNGELLELLGTCQLRSGENEQAVQSLEQAIENAPERVTAYHLLSYVLTDENRRLGVGLETDRLAQADAWMKQMLASNPDSPSALLTYVEYLAGLTRVNTIEDAWKHPLLLDEMIQALLRESVEAAVEQLALPSDDADDVLPTDHSEAIEEAVAKTVTTIRRDLVLDDPRGLLQAALAGIRVDNLTDEDFDEAGKEALAALEEELSPDEFETVQAAAKQGVIVAAARHLLGLLQTPSLMLRSAKLGVLDDATSHTVVARTYLAADRDILAAAENKGLLEAAVEHALNTTKADALALASKEQTIATAVDQATEEIQLPQNDNDPRPKAATTEVLVDTLRDAFRDRKLTADDPAKLQEVVQQSDELDRILARAVTKREGVLERHDRRAVLLLARVALANQQSDQALAYLEEGLRQYPDDVNMRALQADIDEQTGRPEDAVAGLRKGLEATGNNPLLLWKIALLLINTGATDEAEEFTQQLAATEYSPTSELPPPEVAESFLLARLALRKERWLAASKRMEELRDRLTQWPDLLTQADVLLGVAYTQLGDVDRQLAAFRRVIGANPFHRAALIGMAEGLERRGKINEALEYRQRLATLSGSNTLQFVRTLLQVNLRRPPEDRDWREIQAMLDQIAASEPESAAVAILQAEVYSAQGKTSEAQATLNEAWQRHPQDTTVWSTLTSLEQQLENWDRVEELLRIAEDTIDDKVVRLLVRLQYETGRYVDEIPQRIEAAMTEAQSFPEEDRTRALNSLLSASLRLNADEQARKICRQLSAEDPDNVRIHFLWFQLTVRTKDEKAMREALAKIEQIEGKSAHWYYGSAVILSLTAEDAEDKRLDQALQMLGQARRQRPDWGQAIMLEAGIYDRKGEFDLALRSYLRAIELGEGSSKAYRRAVDLLTYKGRHAEAENLLEDLRRRGLTSTEEDLRRQGRVEFAKGNLDEALRIARQVAEGSEMYQDHVWLARLSFQKARTLQGASQADKAQELASAAEQSHLRAVELSDTSPNAWLPLIHFYSATGSIKKAKQALAEAKTKISLDENPLAMAQIHEAMGEVDEARKSYTEALNESPDNVNIIKAVIRFYIRNENIEEAEAQLQRILGGELKTDPATIAWARRRQAGILRIRGGYPNLKQAIDLIEKNSLSEGSTAEDTLMLAELLAGSPSRADRERALNTFDSLPSPSPGNRFTLAQLYLAHGETGQGIAVLRNLVAEMPNQAQYLAAYVDVMLDQDQLQTAETYLKKLEELAPNHFNVVKLRAEALFRQKEYTSALNLLTGFLTRADAQPTNDRTRFDAVATQLEDFRRRLSDAASEAKTDIERGALERTAEQYASQSELVLQNFVSTRPSFRLLLAVFLAKQGKIDKALGLVEQAWSDGSAEVIARAMIALMRNSSATPEQLERANKVLQAAIDKYDTSLPLLLAAADIRSSQGRYQEAEAIYRDVLKIDPDSPTAKNNLAVLLAQQKIKLNEAKKLIAEALEAAGPIPQILDSQAIVNLAAGNPQKALDVLRGAIAQESTPVKLFHKAQALDQLNRRDEAVTAWQEAVEAGLDADAVERLERPAYQQLKKKLEAPQ